MSQINTFHVANNGNPFFLVKNGQYIFNLFLMPEK